MYEAVPKIPVNFLNAFVYCPRRFYLEFVEGIERVNLELAKGRATHQTPSRLRGQRSDESGKQLFELEVSHESLGLVGKIDTLAGSDDGYVIIEEKSGRHRDQHNARPCAWPGDEIQIAALATCAEDLGYPLAPYAIVHYKRTDERVHVLRTPELHERLLQTISQARHTAKAGVPPPPLETEEKCGPCSLLPICRPEEAAAPQHKGGMRVADPLSQVVYVDTPGAYVSVKKDYLEVRCSGETMTRIPLHDTRQVILVGRAEITTPAMVALLRHTIPTAILSSHGRFVGSIVPPAGKNVEVRRRQVLAFEQTSVRLQIASPIIAAKIRNSRTLLARQARSHPEVAAHLRPALNRLKWAGRSATDAESLDTLLGIEGGAAANYFACWPHLLRHEHFDWQKRTRRPPRDAVSAVLGFVYSLLAKEVFAAVSVTGMDPYMGLYHAPKYGRPSLVLDLMEPFRPVVADAAALDFFNRTKPGPRSFLKRGPTCYLSTIGRRKFYPVFERRMTTEIRHPVMGYPLSLRRMLELEARLLAAKLRGDREEYQPFLWR